MSPSRDQSFDNQERLNAPSPEQRVGQEIRLQKQPQPHTQSHTHTHQNEESPPGIICRLEGDPHEVAMPSPRAWFRGDPEVLLRFTSNATHAFTRQKPRYGILCWSSTVAVLSSPSFTHMIRVRKHSRGLGNLISHLKPRSLHRLSSMTPCAPSPDS